MNIAIAGATGLVGSTILKLLEERDFKIDNLYPLASEKSKGKLINFKGKEYETEVLKDFDFTKSDLVFFAAGGDRSKEFAKKAVDCGAVVIDNSSVFRMDKEVPLVVPEVNPEALKNHKGIIANPNCSTIQCMKVLKIIDELSLIKRVVYATYQSVSGSGLKGLRDLDEGVCEFYPKNIKGNVIPHIDSFLDNGYTKEEMKMIDETKKILNREDLKITCTCVRVPVRFAHSVSINVETEKAIDIDKIRSEIENTKNLILMDDISKNIYPVPTDAEGKDEIFVGRIRRDESVQNGLNLWVVADNIRKGAALNAVEIAEKMIEMGLLK